MSKFDGITLTPVNGGVKAAHETLPLGFWLPVGWDGDSREYAPELARRWNDYPKLVEALKRFIDEFGSSHCECKENSPHMHGKTICDYCFGRQILTDANGTTPTKEGRV